MRQRGFTLVELLVTLALMGIMALICWRGLAYVAAQRGEVEREALEVAHLVRTFSQLERDLAQRLPDTALPARPEAPELPRAVSVLDNHVEILRFAPQAGLMQVRYRVDARGLARNDAMLLPGAAALKVRVHAGGFWSVPGDPRVQPPAPATAIEFAVEDGRGGRYVRVLAL
jgi:prepilin-type N-terminal cleavage/methylation domain-containing protein